VLLCDVDHGLVHDLDLTMARRAGRLIVTAPDGRRVWGTADAAFTDGLTGSAGLDGLEPQVTTGDDRFTGIHPLDQTIGRRPAAARDTTRAAGDREAASRDADGRDAAGRDVAGQVTTPRADQRGAPAPSRATARPSGTTRPDGAARPGNRRDTRRLSRTRAADAAAIGATLFPAGEPDLPAAFCVNGERMDLRYVVSVLLGHRDLIRRTAAEAGVDLTADVGP
jgi:hypothetical protein